MHIFSSSQARIDPETGEVLPDLEKKTLSKSHHSFFENKYFSKTVFILLILLNVSIVSFVYFSLKKEIEYLHFQFEALFEGVEEGEFRINAIAESVEEVNLKMKEALEADEEFASVNFWGDNQTAAHLQSIKFIGYYEINGQRIAYTKSQLGDRFLTKNEVFNDHWRIKDITSNTLVLVGENDKTYTVLKEEQP